jgi:hypothetical protein
MTGFRPATHSKCLRTDKTRIILTLTADGATFQVTRDAVGVVLNIAAPNATPSHARSSRLARARVRYSCTGRQRRRPASKRYICCGSLCSSPLFLDYRRPLCSGSLGGTSVIFTFQCTQPLSAGKPDLAAEYKSALRFDPPERALHTKQITM